MNERRCVIAGVLSAAVFTITTVWVVSAASPTGVDTRVTSVLIEHRATWTNAFMRVLTWLGSNAVLIPLVAAFGASYWLRRRDRLPAFFMAAALGGAVALQGLVKWLVARPRPPASLHLAHVSSSSYPSGHATQAAAVWGMTALILGVGRSSRTRIALWAAAALISMLVAFSRVYLGVHWVTDVIGGLALGTLWLSVLGIVFMRLGADTAYSTDRPAP